MADQDYLINFTATGDAQAAAAARNVSAAVGEVGDKAEGSTGGFGSFTSSVVSFAGKAAVAGAAIKLVSTGLEEIAETEGASEALRKAGISADAMSSALQAVDDIELFTNDKVTAARIYGDVMNGRTRELKAMGIELSANATQEEKLAAIQELRRRGMAEDAARVGTLTGEWSRLKRGVGNFIEARFEGGANLLAGAIGWVNKNVLGLSTEVPKLTRQQIANAKAAEDMAKANRLAAAGVKEGEEAVKKFTDALAKQSEAAKRANDENIAADDAEFALQMQEVDNAEAGGGMSKEAAEEERRRIRWEQKDRELGNQRDALKRREEKIAEEERAAKGILQPGDAIAGTIGENEAAKARLAESAARMAAVEEERRKLQAEKEINEKKARLNDLQRQGEQMKGEAEEKQRIDEAVNELLDGIAADEKKIFERRKNDRLKREDEAAKKKNAAKLKEAEDARKAAEQRKKDIEALGKGIEAANKELENAENADKGSDRDRNGRKRIKAPASPNELAPLPDRTAPATDKLKDTTQDAAKKAEANLKATENAVNRNTAAVVNFAQTTQNAFADVDSKLASLENRIKSNL